jgi:hypothetical protein
VVGEVWGYVLDVSEGEQNETGAEKADDSGALDEELSEEAVVHLAEVPFAHFLLLQQVVDYSEVVGQVLLFVPVPQHDCMQVQQSELVGQV